MLFRHVVPNDCAPFEFDTITYASETLNLLFTGVKGRGSPCHDSTAIMQVNPRRLVNRLAATPAYFSVEKVVGIRS